MTITDYVIGLYDHPSYLAGRQAYASGKHLIVPEAEHREAWTLGWNDEWHDQKERDPS